MYPSSFRIRATSAFSFEVGISTRAWRALAALRIRVSKSEIGSVCIVVFRRLPAGLHHAGNFPAQRVGSKTNAAHLKFSQVTARPAAQAATVAYANLELQLLAHLGELRISRHRLLFLLKISIPVGSTLHCAPGLYSGGLQVEPAPV